jgi:hypothetical protein
MAVLILIRIKRLGQKPEVGIADVKMHVSEFLYIDI